MLSNFFMSSYNRLKNVNIYIKIAIVIMIIIVFMILLYQYIALHFDLKFLAEMSEYGISSSMFPERLGYNMSPIYSHTYGEIKYDGMLNIYKLAKEYHLTHTFIDLGCGVGKSLLMARLVGFKDVVGVEIVKGRYDIAIDLMKKMPATLSSRIYIYEGDSSTFIPQIPLIKPYFVFISNIMYEDEENINIFEHLVSNYPLGSIIISSAIPDKPIKVKSKRYLVTKKVKLNVPMSWYHKSMCYVSIIAQSV